MPLGGDPFPDLMHYEPDLTQQIRYECEDKVNDMVKSLPIAAESDVEVSHQGNTDIAHHYGLSDHTLDEH